MWNYAAYILLALVAGLTSALFGIGGGIVLVPALIMFFAVPARVATTTALAYIAPIALYGILRQWHMGLECRWALALAAVPIGLLGAELGSRAKQHMPNAQLQALFGLLLIAVGVHLALQGWGAMRKQKLSAANPRQAQAASQEQGPPAR